MLGQNGARIQSAGLDLGNQGDLPQAYVVLNLPTPNGTGVQIKAGKMVALPGVESAYDVQNPNVSLGYQAVYVEMATGTGVDVDHRFNSHFDADVRVLNGWDVVRDNNHHVSIGARAGITADSATSVNLVAWMGPEEAGNDSSMRYGVDAVLNHQLSPQLSGWIQGDYGREDANAALADPTQAARWWGIGGMAPVRPALVGRPRGPGRLSERRERRAHERGARTSDQRRPANRQWHASP